MAELLNEKINAVIETLAASFVFRKLGVCYDLKAKPDAFPRETLPTAKEISASQPDACGTDTAMVHCAFNNAVLFDGYAARLEIGFARPEEDRVFDRLIGGAIRLATIAPKNALINGLSPDGKSYYPQVTLETCICWAFYAWRVATTATVSPESQGKLKNIASRWAARLQGDDFVLPGGEPVGGADWLHEPVLPALAAVTWALTGEQKWRKMLDSTAPFAAALPAQAGAHELLLAQIALHLVAEILPEEGIGQAARARMRDLARLATIHLGAYRKFVPPAAPGALDWRRKGEGGQQPADWQAFFAEKETLTVSAEAALCCVLCKDADFLAPYAEALRGVLDTPDWSAADYSLTLCPLVAIHARGVELGLWDKELGEYAFSFDSSTPLVEKFMSEDYDELNPERAGHVESARKALEPEEEDESGKARSEGRRRRRRRKRK